MYLFIHRRDLRTYDLPAFTYLAQTAKAGIHILILDDHLLSAGRHAEPGGRAFLQRVEALVQQYAYYEKTLHVLHGRQEQVVEAILDKHSIDEIVVHRDLTPYAISRDEKLHALANRRGLNYTTFLEHLLVDPFRFQSFSEKPDVYKVFTPFYKKWCEFLLSHPVHADPIDLQSLQTASLSDDLLIRFKPNPDVYPVSADLRLSEASDAPRQKLATFLETQVEHYKEARDFYYYDSTSRISLFLNTGAISAREVYETAVQEQSTQASAWIRQLAWRDFYLYQSAVNPIYYQFEQQYDFQTLSEQHFERWASGETGIPIVDAAMRELNETGRMHNRLRMVTAMFLTKNLLCPFMPGEQHFRKKLLDYDNALNRGGWLWSSSLGYDGAPYFRVMNPVMQSMRFDPQGIYIRRWLPELRHLSDEQIHLEQKHAIVDLKESRQLAIDTYKTILEKAKNSTK